MKSTERKKGKYIARVIEVDRKADRKKDVEEVEK